MTLSGEFQNTPGLPSAMQKTPRIVLVDDNPDDRALVARELQNEFGLLFLQEVRNEDELAAALGKEFDLVITDYHLCWTDGLEILQRIKKHRPNCPVIMFTGTGSEEIAVRAMKAGLEDYVLKSPKHYVRLAAAVRSTLERVQTASRADQLEKRFQTLLNRLDVGVFRANAAGMILEANPAFVKLMGWTHLPQDVHLRELYFRPELNAEHLHQLKQTGNLHEHEVELCRADGASVLVSMSQAASMGVDGEQLIDGLVEDISAHAKIEEQLRQTQKLESIGRLAAGVAHDFNNILTIIQGYAGMLADKNFDSDTTFSLKNIASAAERAATLTRRLLAFSRKQAIHTDILDLNQLIQNFTNLLHHLLDGKITLQIHCAPDLPRIRADEGMIEQVLMDLALNARDAMPEGGMLTITTTVVEMQREYIRSHWEARPGKFISLTVADTGCGIPPENLSHIFEPFFTTKDVGKGTGLGLASVYGIVKQHKGWIEVSSGIRQGTMFKIYLPAESNVIVPISSKPVSESKARHETVLLVEDEPDLLELVGEILQSGGYHVLSACSGKKALEIWEHARQKIDILVTDMKMPDGLGGLELAQKLVSDNPRLKVLYTSGYSPDLIEPKVHLREGFNYLQKPYPPERLLSTIRNCLEPKA